MDNAPGPRFVTLTFLIGFGLGVFIGVGLALIALGINDPEEVEPRVIEVLVFPTATATLPPQETPPASVLARAAVAVHVGPGEEFATLGTVTRGDVLDVIGRDFDSQWLVIRFPFGSIAQGWIPAAAAEGMTFSSLRSLAVLLPTPLPIEITSPPPFFGTPGTPGTGTPGPGTPGTATATLGPPPNSMDLAVFDVSVLPDGRVRVVILNGGPADLTDGLLVVTVRTLTLESETINYANVLPAGATLTLTTSSFTVGTEPTQVQVVIDPSAILNDSNRINNVATETLGRPADATATPTTPGAS